MISLHNVGRPNGGKPFPIRYILGLVEPDEPETDPIFLGFRSFEPTNEGLAEAAKLAASINATLVEEGDLRGAVKVFPLPWVMGCRRRRHHCDLRRTKPK